MYHFLNVFLPTDMYFQTLQKELESKYSKIRQLERQIDQQEADQEEKVSMATDFVTVLEFTQYISAFSSNYCGRNVHICLSMFPCNYYRIVQKCAKTTNFSENRRQKELKSIFVM